MREILFRGKQVDTGEWLQGFLSQSRNIKEKPAILKLCIEYEEKGIMMFGMVDPKTVGQFTGLTDKNGKRIFEGDIIKTKKYGKDVGHSNVNDYDIFVVKYEPAMFRLENHNRGFVLDDDRYSKYEVIGNIHDNPELLKEVAQNGG